MKTHTSEDLHSFGESTRMLKSIFDSYRRGVWRDKCVGPNSSWIFMMTYLFMYAIRDILKVGDERALYVFVRRFLYRCSYET